MHRLFVAIRPPATVRAQLIAAMGGVPGARWQDGDQLHATLRFIGEVERPLAEEVAIALGSLRAAPFALRVEGVGSFDRRGRVHTLWAGLRPHDDIARLHRKVDQALAAIGLPREGRAYLPHVTLARMGGSAGPVDRFLADHAGLASPPFPVEHFYLYESTLGHEGARYEAIERYPLRG
ncbi:RNA 2',3'-cyclic phosphodiesterase [Sphingomonas baiyangensis]|uniref:RNA 2',3'-cyclic phosphodiesterase n=1 Tax=Sphingomonas baiyangensis TaxID=2572576 RepID=A0A4U1L2S1_9SPHN|nr:RNA 2',3'-cyclic phosphodiesterase [Sphingomonas baiyangensis]TKD50346.1 RNA 2',3'-cyclic phosphodiesterase [Sphingomonas baiyangensis]